MFNYDRLCEEHHGDLMDLCSSSSRVISSCPGLDVPSPDVVAAAPGTTDFPQGTWQPQRHFHPAQWILFSSLWSFPHRWEWIAVTLELSTRLQTNIKESSVYFEVLLKALIFKNRFSSEGCEYLFVHLSEMIRSVILNRSKIRHFSLRLFFSFICIIFVFVFHSYPLFIP